MEHTIEIIQGSHQKIYQIGAVQYDIHFPLLWALEPIKDEKGFIYGPSDCSNCLGYGSYRGVFIGYCLNCAKIYGYERGNGFITHGVECSEGDNREAKNSVWNTYLKNVKLEDIGWDFLVDPPFVDNWVSDAEEAVEDVDEIKEEIKEEKEDEVFRDVESISSDDLIDFKDKYCPSPKYVETEFDDYHDEFEDDYHDYVDSESEHFYVRG